MWHHKTFPDEREYAPAHTQPHLHPYYQQPQQAGPYVAPLPSHAAAAHHHQQQLLMHQQAQAQAAAAHHHQYAQHYGHPAPPHYHHHDLPPSAPYLYDQPVSLDQTPGSLDQSSTLLMPVTPAQLCCHQCKTSKPESMFRLCCSPVVRRKKSCRKKYCTPCLERSYHMDTNAMDDTWSCPSCEGRCTCAACARARRDTLHTAGETSKDAAKEGTQSAAARRDSANSPRLSSNSGSPMRTHRRLSSADNSNGEDGQNSPKYHPYSGSGRQRRQSESVGAGGSSPEMKPGSGNATPRGGLSFSPPAKPSRRLKTTHAPAATDVATDFAQPTQNGGFAPPALREHALSSTSLMSAGSGTMTPAQYAQMMADQQQMYHRQQQELQRQQKYQIGAHHTSVSYHSSTSITSTSTSPPLESRHLPQRQVIAWQQDPHSRQPADYNEQMEVFRLQQEQLTQQIAAAEKLLQQQKTTSHLFSQSQAQTQSQGNSQPSAVASASPTRIQSGEAPWSPSGGGTERKSNSLDLTQLNHAQQTTFADKRAAEKEEPQWSEMINKCSEIQAEQRRIREQQLIFTLAQEQEGSSVLSDPARVSPEGVMPAHLDLSHSVSTSPLDGSNEAHEIKISELTAGLAFLKHVQSQIHAQQQLQSQAQAGSAKGSQQIDSEPMTDSSSPSLQAVSQPAHTRGGSSASLDSFPSSSYRGEVDALAFLRSPPSTVTSGRNSALQSPRGGMIDPLTPSGASFSYPAVAVTDCVSTLVLTGAASGEPHPLDLTAAGIGSVTASLAQLEPPRSRHAPSAAPS